MVVPDNFVFNDTGGGVGEISRLNHPGSLSTPKCKVFQTSTTTTTERRPRCTPIGDGIIHIPISLKDKEQLSKNQFNTKKFLKQVK